MSELKLSKKEAKDNDKKKCQKHRKQKFQKKSW